MIESLVSTIIPVYNRPSQLREAVDSVLCQDYRPIEILIVDDGSTDETFKVAQALVDANPGIVRVVSQSNSGPGAARELGRTLAAGEFIQYLDSDDFLLPGKFSSQIAALRADSQADVAYGITYVRDAAGTLDETPHKRTGERIEHMFPAFIMSRWWETATPLYRRRATDAAGPWTTLNLEEDWEYDCRIASVAGRLVWVPVPVSEHRDHPGERLSRGQALDPSRLRQRATSHLLILAHARLGGVAPNCPEMRHFTRELFLVARQCGAAGLADESRKLFKAARDAAGRQQVRAADFQAYRALTLLVGWRAAGKASCWIDRLRGGQNG
ncbi:glycosyltransferase family 2 protein [Caenimonas koreensis]|uniref:glycosyltransferase family 2 protein n=1 Tax=Caenimonas koreensis TaxID=367474 RepID=UPI003782E6CF